MTYISFLVQSSVSKISSRPFTLQDYRDTSVTKIISRSRNAMHAKQKAMSSEYKMVQNIIKWTVVYQQKLYRPGMVLNTSCSYRDSICYYKRDEIRVLHSSEIQVKLIVAEEPDSIHQYHMFKGEGVIFKKLLMRKCMDILI